MKQQPDPPHPRARRPQEPSEAVKLEVATLRTILGLPPEPTDRAPPETTQPDKPIPPQDTTIQP